MILNQKTRFLYFGILLIFSVVGLVYFRNILLPLAYSYTFAVFVFPFYKWLRRLRLYKGISVGLVTAVFLLVSVSMIYLFTFAIQGALDYVNMHNREVMEIRNSFYRLLTEFNVKQYFVDEKGMDRVLSLLQYFSFSVVNYLSLFVLSFIYYVFIFIAPDRVLEKYINYKRVGDKLRLYIKYKFVFSLVTALAISFILMAMEIDYWPSISIFVFVLNFIPNIGSIVATLLPLPMFFLKYGFGVEFWFLLSSTSFIQFLVGNMIEPKVMGNLMDVPAIIVVIALLFWGKIWGAMGVFFAVPSLIAVYHFYPRIRRYLS